MSGSSRKYFLYAIGEIALVVIGILIALQINTWNEYRKDRILEKEYIARLKLEMAENLTFFKARVEFDTIGLEYFDLILNALKYDTVNSDGEQLAVAIEFIGWGLDFQHVDDVWNELINNGNIRLLQNDNLRDKTTTYHSEVEAIIDLQTTWIEFSNGYRRLVGNILDPDVRTQIASKYAPSIEEGIIPPVPSQKYMVDELLKLYGLRSYLSDLKMGRSANVAMMKEQIHAVEEIIQICDQELK